MQKFTCLTCRVSLSSADVQRDHYKSEWHIYNLKRKLNQLAPLPEAEYQVVLEKHTAEANPETPAEPLTFYCETCSKLFTNEKAFTQHNASKKHLAMVITTSRNGNRMHKVSSSSDGAGPQSSPKVEDGPRPVCNEPKQAAAAAAPAESAKKTEEVIIVDGDAEDFNDSDWEEVDSDEEVLEGIPITECLFCGEQSADMAANLVHMSQAHTFFIPDVEYCVDLKGLLNYLGIKIASGRCCLYCSDYGKQFASKKSAQQHMLDKGHSKIKMDSGSNSETLLEFEDFYDYSASYPDGEGGERGEGSAEEINIEELDGSDYQLKLPSGAIIGHRSLFVYYKQHLKAQPAEKRSRNKELLNKVMTNYKALGWTGATTRETALQRAKDIGHMHRIYQKSRMRLGKKANLTSTPHLRDQLAFK